MFGPELQKSALSVSAVAFFISNMLKNQLQSLLIRGEISGLRRGAKGSYVYYSLIDDKAKLECLTHISSRGAKVLAQLQEGDEVIVLAQPSFYMAGGKLSFFTDEVMRLGEGAFATAAEQLKQKLYEEGLFKAEAKKPLPPFPIQVGVVTSAEGAVLQDILRVAKDRWPLAEISVFPALVQGEKAPQSLQEALTLALSYPLDAIIIGRGGGSSEDLAAFNDEALVRLIYGARTPILSAVGHETDMSLCDYVSDYSAPTPTGAAMKLFPDRWEILKDIQGARQRLNRAYGQFLREEHYALDSLRLRMDALQRQRAEAQNHELSLLRLRLEAANPERALERGYAVLLDEEGRRPEAFSHNQKIQIVTAGHLLSATVDKAVKR